MEEDVCEEYKSSLLDLTCNSKPLINMLTMLAEENVQQAPRIVRSIEEHLQKVPVDMKLPVLYLIDSIMKNVGNEYRALFTQNIVSNFCNVFEKGDERMRMQLFKLRQTWVEIFPNKKLFALDTRVKQMDPAWPIMAKEPQQTTTIHVNPKFLEAKAKGQDKETMEQQAAKLASLNALDKATTEKILCAGPPSSEGEAVKRMLLQKQQEFILLQRQKLQLELQMQQQQLRQKQEAEQLLKSLRPPSSVAVPPRAPPPMPASGPTNLAVPRLQAPVAARDPRLQQRPAPLADSNKPPVSSVGPVQSAPQQQQQHRPQPVSVVVAPPHSNSPNAATLESASPDRHGNNRLSAREKHAAIRSPPKKFRIPKTSDRNKAEEDSSKNGDVAPSSSPTKASSPSKARKATEDKDERQYSRAGSVKSSSSSSSSSSSAASQSQSRGGKKGRGKGNKDKGEENVRPNGDVEMADALLGSDVDMRVVVEKRDSGDTVSGEAPLHKRQKGHTEESLADFDYRKPPDRPGVIPNASQRGWAQYKAKHPDEFKSPLRPARENMDVRDEDMRQLQDSIGRGGPGAAFHGRGPMQPSVDRFGRPLLRKLMSDPRFRSHVGGQGSPSGDLSQQQQQMYEMLADPDMYLQQTEEQLRAGRLDPNLHRELKAQLEKISQFRKAQPQSPILPIGWQGGPPGPGFPPWNQQPFSPMNKDLPPPLEPAPSVGTIRVDTKMRKVQFVEDIAVVLMDGCETRQIMFKGPPKRVFIDEMEPVSLPFDGTTHEFISKRTGKKRTFKFGAPLREIFLDGVPYCAQFDNSPNVVKTADGEVHVIRLEPPPPTVDIEKRPPEHILRALNLHPEKLADTDQDLRTLPPPLPVVEGSGTDNAMDVDMRLPPRTEGAKDVDLRKRVDVDEGGGGDAPWNSPRQQQQQQQAGKAGWTQQQRTQQQPEDGFQPRENKESGGWVRYGSPAEERAAANSNWPQQQQSQQQQQQQPPRGPPQQDVSIHQPWPPGPGGEWNNFGNDFMPGRGMPGVGPGRRGNQQPGFGGKEYPSYFREEFPQPQMPPPPRMSVGEVRPGFMPPQYPCRPPFGGPSDPAGGMPMGAPRLGGPPPPPQALLASGLGPPTLGPPPQAMAPPRPHLVGPPPEGAGVRPPVFLVAQGQPPPQPPPIQQQPPPMQQPPMQQPPPMQQQPPNMQQVLQQPPTMPAMQPAMQQPPPFQPPMTQAPAIPLPGPYPPPAQMDVPPATLPPQAAAQPAALDVNVGELFSKLVAAGILKQGGNGNGGGGASAGGNAAGTEQQQLFQGAGHSQKKKRRRPRVDHSRQEPKKPVEGIPPLSFSRTDQLKIKHPSVISALHVGTQCASCGLRFTDEKCEKYRQHLDWHFRANRRDKDGARKAFSRKWFYEVEDWIQFEEIEDLEERARSFFEQQATVEQDQNSSNSPMTIKSVPASGDETGNTCAVCEEAFQLFWAEEEEQWHFKDAIRIENKVYHPACYEDFKRAAEAPSPVKMEPEEAQPEAATSEDNPMEVDVKAEAGEGAGEDEKPAVEGGADGEAPDVEMAEVADVEEKVALEGNVDDGESTCVEGGLQIKDEKAGSSEMQDDPVVVVDNLGEFGVSLSDVEQSGGEEERATETAEPPKVVVKGTGGIVMKVKAESIQAPASPVPAPAGTDAAGTDAAGTAEPPPAADEPTSEDEEFRPPTPDPRFQSLPPVQRGNELSGLCCIM